MKFFWCLLLLGIAVAAATDESNVEDESLLEHADHVKSAILELYNSATEDEKDSVAETISEMIASSNASQSHIDKLNAAVSDIFGYDKEGNETTEIVLNSTESSDAVHFGSRKFGGIFGRHNMPGRGRFTKRPRPNKPNGGKLYGNKYNGNKPRRFRRPPKGSRLSHDNVNAWVTTIGSIVDLTGRVVGVVRDGVEIFHRPPAPIPPEYIGMPMESMLDLESSEEPNFTDFPDATVEPTIVE